MVIRMQINFMAYADKGHFLQQQRYRGLRMRTETATEDRDFWDEPLPPLLPLRRLVRAGLPARVSRPLSARVARRVIRRSRVPSRSAV